MVRRWGLRGTSWSCGPRSPGGEEQGPRGKEQAFRGGLGWREASSVGQGPAYYWEGREREWGFRGEGVALSKRNKGAGL